MDANVMSGNESMHEMDDMDMQGGMHDMHDMHGMMDMDHSMHMSMKMTFYFGNELRILFDCWKVTNDAELIGSIIAVFIMAFFYEGLKTMREYLVSLDVKKNKQYLKSQGVPMDIKVDAKADFSPDPKQRGWFASTALLYLQWQHLLQSVLHVIQTGWGYLLMLIAMTYNGWLFMAVCFGAGAGYLVFARFRYMLSTAPDFREQTEPCH